MGDQDRTELAATEPPPINAVAPWLLRVGIDHSGQLDLTQLWDIGIRGAVLADLWLAGRISDGTESLQIDLEPTGIRYLDVAAADLADSGDTELRWIAAGRLHAPDLAADLVASGEWTRHWSVSASRWRVYRSQPKQQYVPLRKRVAHTYDGEITPASEAEASVALLGHALNVVRPRRIMKQRLGATTDPLPVSACGAAATVVGAAIVEIAGLAGSIHANSNPAW
jgi:hypothetical protein